MIKQAEADFEEPMKGTGNAQVVTKTETTVTGGESTKFVSSKSVDNETSLALRKQAEDLDKLQQEGIQAGIDAGGTMFDYMDTDEYQQRQQKIGELRMQANDAMSFIPSGEIDYDREGNEIGRRGFGDLVNPGDPGHHYKGSLSPSVLDTGNAVGNMTRLSQEASAAAAAPIVVPAPAPAPAPSSDTPKIVGVTVEPGVRLAKDSAQLRAQDRRTIG